MIVIAVNQSVNKLYLKSATHNSKITNNLVAL